MRRGTAVLLLAGAVLAAPDAAKDWRAELKRLDRKEKEFWKGAKKRLQEALDTVYDWRRRSSADEEKANNPERDFSGFANLYEDYEILTAARSKVDLALAESGHAKAGATLLKTLLDVIKQADKLEADILKGRPKHNEAFDQKLSIERHGLAVRRDGLVAALAKVPDAATFLAGEGLGAAAKDGRRSVARRTAILDALALAGGRDARSAIEPFLDAKESSLRLVAVQGLLRFGAEARPVLVGRLHDPAPAVQRALVRGIADHAGDDAGWIGPVLDKYEKSTGVIRWDCVRTLGVLTKQTFGHAPKLWREWFEDYKKEIEGGKFDRNSIEVREAKPAPPTDALTFYGVGTPSRTLLFVLDGSWPIHWPAALKVQLSKYKWDWHRTRNQWEKTHASHQVVLKREFRKMSRGFDKETLLGVIALHGSFKTDAYNSRLQKASPGTIKGIEKHIDSLLGDGWCAQYHGLLAAAELANVAAGSDVDFAEPRADTIFLVSPGDARGGRYMSTKALVAAFKRFNRYRQLVVHTIRLCDEGESSVTLMKGLAEASGGTYVWADKPPE